MKDPEAEPMLTDEDSEPAKLEVTMVNDPVDVGEGWTWIAYCSKNHDDIEHPPGLDELFSVFALTPTNLEEMLHRTTRADVRQHIKSALEAALVCSHEIDRLPSLPGDDA